jgi:phospholipid-translocating ATPase
MKKLHMGTMSYGFDSMDEVAHQLHVAFGTSDQGGYSFACSLCLCLIL